MEVAVQEPPFIGRRGPADHVDRRGPCRRVGALRGHDGVGGRQRHVLPGPLGGSYRVDRHELTGQQRYARLQSLIVEDRTARQMGHQERRVLAMRGGRIDRDQSRSRHAGPREQGQGVGLPVQRVLGMLHVDEGPQHQVTGASVPRADGQPRISAVMPPCSASVLTIRSPASRCRLTQARVNGRRAASSRLVTVPPRDPGGWHPRKSCR